MSADDGDLPFRMVAQHLPTPCWISDSDGNITWVNDAWVEYTGRDVATLRTEGLAPLHDPAFLSEVSTRWSQTKAAGTPAEMTFPMRAKDGTFRLFLTRVVPLRGPDGRVERWFGTNTDVSREAEATARATESENSLRENEARLRLATEAAGVGIWEWRLDTNEMIYSDRARAICGFALDQPVTYAMVVAATHPEDLPRTSAQATRALDPAIRDRSAYDYRIVRPSGEIRWVTASGEAIFETNAEGALVATRYVGTLIDMTERRNAEDAVRKSEQQLQMVLRSSRMAAWRVNAQGELLANPELNALIGLPPDARPVLAELEENYPPGELDRIREALQATRARGERHFEMEYRYRRADGQLCWFYTRAEARVTADGAPDGALGIVMDITERKTDEERLRFLAREVDHRANNLLTVVEGIISLSRGGSVDELRGVLRGRVHALAHAHQLLAEARWAGAELHVLAADELAPYALGAQPDRVRIEGPPVLLAPASAQSVAMVLHELATNAVKHGALSVEGGRVELTWRLDGAFVEACWRECDGPPVRPPERKGFGGSVIDRALRGAVGGEARLEWRSEGLVCTFRARLAGAD